MNTIEPPPATTIFDTAAATEANATGNTATRLSRQIDLGICSRHISTNEAPRAGSQITVFTNGCFDLFHAGHVDLLRQARSLGDRLVVGINSDDSVRTLKGSSRPIHPMSDRCQIVAACRYVDEVHVFHELTPCNLIRQFRPHIIAKGPGYGEHNMPEAGVIREWGGKVVILNGPQISTTSIIERICHRA